MNKKLKYLGYDIVFQEIPNHITLAINISGCPYCCKDCHSKYLWEYEGNYISNDIEELLDQYKNYISCVCFMGGNQNSEELTELCRLVHKNLLATALYTGCDHLESLDKNLKKELDYIKIGHFDIELGGLNSKTTNQRLYAVTLKDYIDITSMFWEKN